VQPLVNNLNLLSNMPLIDINKVDEKQIYSAISKLKANMTSGLDQIPAFIIKDCANVFLKPLSILFNMCLKTATFPEVWKQSRITPVHKSGDKLDIKNYRPITILNNFSKVFESILYNVIYLATKNYIISEQHGFFSSRSTTTNLICLTDYLNKVLDMQKQADVIYIDLSKAFDSINHKILLNKLDHLGFGNHLKQFFYTYLRDRKNIVAIKGNQSIFHLQKECLKGLI
jgi:hypothetical protein